MKIEQYIRVIFMRQYVENTLFKSRYCSKVYSLDRLFSCFFMAFLTIVLFCLLLDNCKTFPVSKYTQQRINEAINCFLKDDSRVAIRREWPSALPADSVTIEHYTTPSIIIWDVLRSFRSVLGNLQCPFCAENQQEHDLKHAGLWTDGSSNCRYEPRLIYDSSCCILLVSAVYVCPHGHQVPSHHPSILSRLPSSHYSIFYLTNRAGFSIEFLSQITALVDHGISFHGIEDIVREQYEQAYWRLRLRYEDDCRRGEKESAATFPLFSQDTYPFPHEKLIRSVFVSYSMLFLSKFHTNMAGRTSSWISCDHTFKSVANIGFVQVSDGTWVRLFNSLFCVLGDNGNVLHWRFTRGESFREVSDIFTDLQRRFQSLEVNIEGIIIDNCCKWRGMFASVLPEVPVKLDLFHAVQRFTGALAREVRVKSGIAKEYGMIFRDPSDLGVTREKCTPDPITIGKNLDSFEKKWTGLKWNGISVINENAKKAIGNLRIHIEKGCLSGIPPRCSTGRNERLHRELNYILHSNKIGLEMAYVRCSRMFFRHNNNNPGLELCCPQINPPPYNDFIQGFGVEKGICFKNSESAVLGLTNDGDNVIASLQQLKSEDINKIKTVISSSMECCEDTFEDHDYSTSDRQKDETALRVALDGISLFEIFRGMEDLGYARFLSKTNLPNSIGIGTLAFKKLSSVTNSAHKLHNEHEHASFVDKTLHGHLTAFGLEHVSIPGDGNCFFSAVSFHLSLLLSSSQIPNALLHHLNSIGISRSMLVADIANVLRMLVVREWRGNREDSYRNFLPENYNYHSETVNFEVYGYFGSDLGDLMPIAMANVLQMPIIIVTSEPHTPLISVCPEETVLYSEPLFLAYNSLGVGHYDAAVSIEKCRFTPVNHYYISGLD